MVTINIQVQCPVLLWVWLQIFELLCDDPRNTVLMTKEEMRRFAKYYGSDLLGHRDDEVRVSDV